MGYTKEQLLACLQELQIDFAQHEHPVVLTVEAQAKYVGHMKGALSKNLFLKDKKHRFYIVSALADTKVDLKVLSQRLGLGKGGLRMAPEEALGEMLQVPLGCITPFALVNDSARHVCLLLDQGFKSQECCFFHPLPNDMSVAKAVKPSNASQKEKSDSAVNLSGSFGDPEKLVEEILEKTTSIVLSEVKEENMEKYWEQLGTMVSNCIRTQLSVELKSILVTLDVQEHIIYRRLLLWDATSAQKNVKLSALIVTDI